MSVRFNDVTKSWETVPWGANSLEAMDQERRDTIPAPPPSEPETLPTGGCIECRQAPCACQFEVETYPQSVLFECATNCSECDLQLAHEERRSTGAHIEAYDRLGEGR